MKIREAQIFSDKVVDLIKIEQQKMNITNYVLAQKSQLSEASLSYIFNHHRRPTLYTLIMITSALGISLSEIVSRAENSQKN